MPSEMGNFKIWPAAPVRANLVAFILIVLSLAGACNGIDVNSTKSNSVNGSVIFDCNACTEKHLAFSDAHVALKCQRGDHLSANGTASVNADGSFIIHLDKVESGDLCSTEIVMPNNKLCSSAKTSAPSTPEKLSVSTPLMCNHAEAEATLDQRPNFKLSIHLHTFHAAPEFSTLTNSIESKQSLNSELFKKKSLPELPPFPFIFKPKPIPKLKPLFQRPPIPHTLKPIVFLKPKFFKPKPLLKPPPFLKPKPLPKPKFLKPKPLPKLPTKLKFLRPKPIPKLPPKPKFFKPKPMPQLPPRPKFFKHKPMPELPPKPKFFKPKTLPKLPPNLEFLRPKPMPELLPKPKFFKPKPLPKLWPKPHFLKPKPLPKLLPKPKFFQPPSP